MASERDIVAFLRDPRANLHERQEEAAAEIERLRKLVKDLADGMKASVDAGCTDHLDCWDDAAEKWYRLLDAARKEAT